MVASTADKLVYVMAGETVYDLVELMADETADDSVAKRVALMGYVLVVQMVV